jgi:hypothetical protein
MDYLANMHRMVPGEKEPQPEDHPAVMANILAAQGAGRAANCPDCPDCPDCPAKWPIFLLGFIIGGLLFFIIGGLAGGWLMSCITKSFCKPCWRPYCPSGMRRRWRASRRVSTSAFEESGAAANSDIALAGPPMTAAELRRAWGDDRPSAIPPPPPPLPPQVSAPSASVVRDAVSAGATPGRTVMRKATAAAVGVLASSARVLREATSADPAPPTGPKTSTMKKKRTNAPVRPEVHAPSACVLRDAVSAGAAPMTAEPTPPLPPPPPPLTQEELKNLWGEDAPNKEEEEEEEAGQKKAEDQKEEEVAPSPLVMSRVAEEIEGEESFMTALQD